MERLDDVKREAARRRVENQMVDEPAQQVPQSRPSTAPPSRSSASTAQTREAYWSKLLNAADVPRPLQVFHGAASFGQMPPIVQKGARVHAVLRVRLPAEEVILPELMRWLLSQRKGTQAPQDRACDVPPFAVLGLQIYSPEESSALEKSGRALAVLLSAGTGAAAEFRTALRESLTKLCNMKRSEVLGRLLSSKADVLDHAVPECEVGASLVAHMLGADADVLDDNAETSVSLIPPGWQERPTLVAACMQRAAAEGLHIAGMRSAVFSASAHPTSFAAPSASVAGGAEPSLVFALRGVDAATRWRAAVGPADAELARLTDAGSLNALHGSSTTPAIVPATAAIDTTAPMRDAALVFGARVPSEGASPEAWRRIDGSEARSAVDATSVGPAGSLLAYRPVQKCTIAAPAASLGDLLHALGRRRLKVRALAVCDEAPREARAPVRAGPRGASVYVVVEGEGARAIAAALCEDSPDTLAGSLAWSNSDVKGWMLARPAAAEIKKLASCTSATAMADVPSVGVLVLPLDEPGGAAAAITAAWAAGLEVVSARSVNALEAEDTQALLAPPTSALRSVVSQRRDYRRRAMFGSPTMCVLCVGADAASRLADLADDDSIPASVMAAPRDPDVARLLATRVFPFSGIPGGESAFRRILDGPEPETTAFAFPTKDVLARGDMERLLRAAARTGFALSGAGLGRGWKVGSDAAGFAVRVSRPNARAQLAELAARAVEDVHLSRAFVMPASADEPQPGLASLLAPDAPPPELGMECFTGKLRQVTCVLVGPLEGPGVSSDGDAVGCAELADVLSVLRTHGFELVGARWLAVGDTRLAQYLRVSDSDPIPAARRASLEAHGALVLAVSRDHAISKMRMELGASAKHLAGLVRAPPSAASAALELAAVDLAPPAGAPAPLPAAVATSAVAVDDVSLEDMD